ncbi:ATP-binding cassette domain-containing protein [Serpentinicella sp. ANB-PHB4]|uniref:ABC transporter ATP-binding protein n=1 Tax=Serpentinicella sp. ANB-PHB4 TaxID=3074076 RepID=UPI002867964A|nr:ATP-binding cassette domain-containing protein [Serpentinicella sp. ANB-PHB4]MDR5658466.1 ATP-binding cassette domain-containing protein [Serpentinicella sp. ANB-PHB4]
MAIIEFEGVTKRYDDSNVVLENLNLQINHGELVTIVGPSGCGKTTLLKMINTLVKSSSGDIYVKGKNIKQWDPIQLRRTIGYVIQQVGLFPHMTIEKNINYVLDIMGKDMNLKKQRVHELIDLVGLSEMYLKKYPRELSGGQKQRVGVARALAADPDIILMDEPFGAVDEIARTKLQDEIIKIHKKLNNTIILVTHDIEEALKLGSKIILLNNGRIEQIGTKEEIVFSPKNKYVESFFGIKGFKAIIDDEKLKEIYDRTVRERNEITDKISAC